MQLRGRDPRTAIGQRADGTIVMVAVDGRRRGWSIGITNWDLAQTLVHYGCITGFALDSGGSTTIAFDGKVLNRPSDTVGRASGRRSARDRIHRRVRAAARTDAVTERRRRRRRRGAVVQARAPVDGEREADRPRRQHARARHRREGARPVQARRGTARAHRKAATTGTSRRPTTSARPRPTITRSRSTTRSASFVSARTRGTIGFTLTRDATIRVTIETRSAAFCAPSRKARVRPAR